MLFVGALTMFSGEGGLSGIIVSRLGIREAGFVGSGIVGRRCGDHERVKVEALRTLERLFSEDIVVRGRCGGFGPLVPFHALLHGLLNMKLSASGRHRSRFWLIFHFRQRWWWLAPGTLVATCR